MLKRIVIFLMVFLMMFACVGCGEKQKDESSNHIESVLKDSIKNTYNAGEYPFDIYHNRDGSHSFEAGTFDSTLGRFIRGWDANVKVELTCLSEPAEAYAVFRLHDDVIGDYYIYFFCRFRSPEQDRNDYNEWEFAGRVMSISKRLSVKDFDSIKIGSTVEDVAKIDPVTSISIPKQDYLSADTFHYTENDGILRITFSRKSINDEYRVSGIELDPTYEVDWAYGSSVEGLSETITQKIKPEHLPN